MLKNNTNTRVKTPLIIQLRMEIRLYGIAPKNSLQMYIYYTNWQTLPFDCSRILKKAVQGSDFDDKVKEIRDKEVDDFQGSVVGPV